MTAAPRTGGLYEVYESRNPLIRHLGRRLLRAIGDEMRRDRCSRGYGLDVGCGKGYMLQHLHTTGAIARLLAVDLDMERVAQVRHLASCADPLIADARELPVRAGTFDYVLAAEVLEHIVDPHIAMREFVRVAVPGAPFFASVPFEPFFRWGNVVRGKHWTRGGRTPAHVNFWGRSQFRKFLRPWLVDLRIKVVFPWLLAVGRLRADGTPGRFASPAMRQ